MLKVGIGYDVHRFSEDRALIIGGVQIDYPMGLLGHSDADVLCHAIGDALLGALGAGDLGENFPPTDEKYKGISSMKILGYIQQMISDRKGEILSIDSTVIAQKPRLAGYRKKMTENIANVLNVGNHLVSVKATTTEGLGFTGREEGIAAQAVALLDLIK